MGVVLPFRRKDGKSITSIDAIITSSEVTPLELQTALTNETIIWCRNLLHLYKRTGRWTSACDAPMTTAVLALKDVCQRLSEIPYERDSQNLS